MKLKSKTNAITLKELTKLLNKRPLEANPEDSFVWIQCEGKGVSVIKLELIPVYDEHGEQITELELNLIISKKQLKQLADNTI